MGYGILKFWEESPTSLVSAQHVHFFCTLSHLRAPQNRHRIISTKILKAFFLNSLVKQLLFELCNGVFLFKNIPQLWWKLWGYFVSLVLGCFPEKSIIHFYILDIWWAWPISLLMNNYSRPLIHITYIL